MAKEKKAPKSAEDRYILSSDAEAILYGLMLVLVSLIGLLNKGPVGQFLTYVIVYLFGAFHIFFFLMLIFFGVYLMIKKRFYHIQIDLKLLGGILLLLGFTVGASIQQPGLTIQNAYAYFSEAMESVADGTFQITSIAQVPLAGGGIIGYFIAGMCNSAVTITGTKIIIIAFIVVGFLLLFKNLSLRFFSFLFRVAKHRKEVRKAAREERELREEEEKLLLLKQQEAAEGTKTDTFSKTVEEQSGLRRDDASSSSWLKEVRFEEEGKTSSKAVIPPPETTFFAEDRYEEATSSARSIVKTLPEEPQKEQEPAQTMKAAAFFEEAIDEVEPETVLEEQDVQQNRVEPQEEPYHMEKPYKKVFEIKEEVRTQKTPQPYLYPPLSLLQTIQDGDKTMQNIRVADDRVGKINELLADFKIGAQVISYTIGPSVTRFDVKINAGVRLNSLAPIQKDLAVRLGGNKTVRLEMIVEGKDTSGIEVGNEVVTTVNFKDCIASLAAQANQKLLIPLGKDISGNVNSISMEEFPHLLVAGTTGSGKSIFIHSMIMSLIMRNRPEELRLMLIDPKKVEFIKYKDLPHLLCPVINDTLEAKVALERLIDEMEKRFDLLAEKGKGAAKLSEFAEIAKEEGWEVPPYIVVIIDEFADFMMNNAKEIEPLIQRLAQKARAAGIFMVIATQRPSVSVITGDIKANIPSRIALSVSSFTDSRTIIDEGGAENLLGKGDLLARIPTSKSLVRLQSAYVSNRDIFAVCDYIKSHAQVQYDPHFLDLKEKSAYQGFEGSALSSGRRTDLDPLHEEVRAHVIETRVASTTNIQNYFNVGFSRAAYILDCLEREGVIRKTSGNRRIVVGDGKGYEEDEEIEG